MRANAQSQRNEASLRVTKMRVRVPDAGWLGHSLHGIQHILLCLKLPTQIPTDLLEQMPLRARLMVSSALVAVARSACCPDLDSFVAIHGDMAT